MQNPSYLLAASLPSRLSNEDAFNDIKELKALVEANNGKVVEYVIQRRESRDKGLYLGRGKISEIVDLIKEKDIAVVALNGTVKPGEIFEITKTLRKANPNIKVLDKVALILEIFYKHAHTAEANLQIKLAEMYHMGPRIYGMGEVMSRQGGGIGTLGVGETNTELMKRHWQKQIKKVKDKLNKLSLERENQLEKRMRIGLPTISLVGYTNAGKSSLFNQLTGKHNVINNALFVTLDSTVGKVKLPSSHKSILISDTIGFIKDLPHDLIEAFQSTLIESVHSDLLLHVIDISDNDMIRKIKVVENLLTTLDVQNKKILYIFNKSELVSEEDKEICKSLYKDFNPQFISVKKNQGIKTLMNTIEKIISEPV